jgi:uncharacterized protein
MAHENDGAGMNERAIRFDCHGAPLVGIFHPASNPNAKRGVLMIVGGGPQFRVGGHRQLVLWARKLADEGYPVLRFDYRGMGDSHGDFLGFEDADDDIRAGIDELQKQAPGLEEVVLWGECDAAAAILFYAYRDARVKSLALLNPWARTEAGQAKTVLRHYYLNRIMQPSFWRKVFSFNFDVVGSLRSALSLVSAAKAASGSTEVKAESPTAPLSRSASLPDRLYTGFNRFKGPVMLVMSGRDLIAREFDDLIRNSASWQQAIAAKPTTRFDLKEGDHTFSSREWRNQVVAWGLSWLRSH